MVLFRSKKTIFRPEGISIRFRPENSFLNSPFGREKSPLSALSQRSFMKNAGLGNTIKIVICMGVAIGNFQF
jgi:hypothetical protein